MKSFIDTLEVELPEGYLYPSDEQIEKAFNSLPFEHDCYDAKEEIWQTLRMWGESVRQSTETVLSDEPHWVATKNGIWMHTDDETPQFVHCLKIRVDDGQYAEGHLGCTLDLKRGTYYSFDCRKPHAVKIDKSKVTREGDLWNVSIVIDSDVYIPPEIAIPRIIEYGMKADFTEAFNDLQR